MSEFLSGRESAPLMTHTAREAFEAWAEAQTGDWSLSTYIPIGNTEAQYMSSYTNLHWQGFLAAWNLQAEKLKAAEEALEAVIKSRDERCRDREEKKLYEFGEFWSPVATMVDSEAIAIARDALNTLRGA